MKVAFINISQAGFSVSYCYCNNYYVVFQESGPTDDMANSPSAMQVEDTQQEQTDSNGIALKNFHDIDNKSLE